MSIFEGVCTAMITPFKDGKIDFESLARNIDFQLESGVNALLACGTTGEPSTMSEDEKISVINFIAQRASTSVPVIAGIGGNDTARTAAFARTVRQMNISAVLAVTPYYNKATKEGLFRHYSEIAKAAALPVIIYNVPGRTNVNITPDVLERLCILPNIAAVKESSGNPAQAAEILNSCGDKIDIYCGNDDIAVAMMAVGSKGIISVLSNIMPSQTVKMIKYCLEGHFPEAAQLQRCFMPLIKSLFSQVNPIPVKAALSLMGLCSNELRLPLTSMTPSLFCDLKENMKALEII